MATYFLSHTVNVRDVDKAWQKFLNDHSCDCADSPEQRGRNRHGHFENDCPAPWWRTEYDPNPTFRVLDYSDWGHLHRDQVKETIILNWLCDMEIERLGLDSHWQLDDWLAYPLGGASITTDTITVSAEPFSLLQDESLSYRRSDTGPVFDALTEMSKGKSWAHKFSYIKATPTWEVLSKKYEPIGDVDGWAFFTWQLG